MDVAEQIAECQKNINDLSDNIKSHYQHLLKEIDTIKAVQTLLPLIYNSDGINERYRVLSSLNFDAGALEKIVNQFNNIEIKSTTITLPK